MKIQAKDIDNIEIGIYKTTWNTQRKSVATIIQWLTEIQPSNRQRVLAMRNEPNETKQKKRKVIYAVQRLAHYSNPIEEKVTTWNTSIV